MLSVEKATAVCTVQDLGRPGFMHMGVSKCGALDSNALCLANLALGNEPNAAAIEILRGEITLNCVESCWVAVTGARANPRLLARGKQPVQVLLNASPTYIPAGGRLQISNRGAAGCSYLAIAGGIDCPEVLGSRATDLNAGFGGIEGHMLGSAEKIQPYPLAPKQKHFLPLECQISARFSLREASPDNVIAILPGPGYAAVQNDLTQIICAKPFIMGADSDRMGARFKCANTRATAALARGDKAGLMASHGVARGAMQLLPDGGLIVLLADAQTTGGYPCIANVIEADLYKLAQLPPGDSVQFIQVNFAQARSASVKQSAALQRAKYSMQQYMRKQSPNHE